MSNYLVGFVSAIYLIATVVNIIKGNIPMALILGGYTIANIGLLLTPSH